MFWNRKRKKQGQRGLVEGFNSYNEPFAAEVEVLETVNKRHRIKIVKITGGHARYIKLPEWLPEDQVRMLPRTGGGHLG